MSNIITSTSSAKDLASVLASGGHGSLGVELFVGKEPDLSNVKDNIITIYDTSPYKPPEVDYGYEYPSVQVRVRRRIGDYNAGLTKVLSVMNTLHGYVGTVGGVKYHVIRVVSGPFFIGEDDKGRPRWTFNCDLQRST